MSSKRSGMEWKNLKIFLVFFLIYAARISFGLINPSDGKANLAAFLFLFSLICLATEKMWESGGK